MCCWLAALGAGLLKSEEILEGVARLRISNDIEFAEETFFAKMTAAKEVIFLASPSFSLISSHLSLYFQQKREYLIKSYQLI